MEGGFADVLAQCYCSAIIRQEAFGEYLNGRDWNIDLIQGVVKFGKDLTFPVQLLGTYSEISGTWLWSWQNPGADRWPPKILEGVRKLRELGDLFNVPELPLEHLTGHEISMVCSELLGGLPYYRGPYPNGALFFIVLEVPADLNAKIAAWRCLNVIMTSLSARCVEDRYEQMCRGCLKAQHFEIVESLGEEGRLKEMRGLRGEEEIVVEFDSEGRLTVGRGGNAGVVREATESSN
jgi:hypothetical protein